MPNSSLVCDAAHDPHSNCRGCGTSIPHSDAILQKFWRCYYCGQSNPFGTSARNLVLPAAFAMLAAVAAMWWTQPFS